MWFCVCGGKISNVFWVICVNTIPNSLLHPIVTAEEVYTLADTLYIIRCFEKEDEIQLRDYHFSIFWSNLPRFLSDRFRHLTKRNLEKWSWMVLLMSRVQTHRNESAWMNWMSANCPSIQVETFLNTLLSVVKMLVAWSSSSAPWHYNNLHPPTLMNPTKLESLVAAVLPQSPLETQSSWQQLPGWVSLSEKCRPPSEARGWRDVGKRSDLVH